MLTLPPTNQMSLDNFLIVLLLPFPHFERGGKSCTYFLGVFARIHHHVVGLRTMPGIFKYLMVSSCLYLWL